jgi:negative regulator of flagellin synthesis FlgM
VHYYLSDRQNRSLSVNNDITFTAIPLFQDLIMEISRHIKSGYSAPTEASTTGKTDPVAQSKATASTQSSNTEPRLEDLQEAMRALPEIDMDQVTAIKQALARGELSSDVKVLAHSILAYHRSSDL